MTNVDYLDGALARILARLRSLDTCSISDALDRLEISGVIDGLRPMWMFGRIAGSVRTVLLERVDPNAERPRTHLGAKAITAAMSGEIILVDNQAGQGRSAGWGGLLGLASMLQGVGGIVVYGACRDVDDLAGIGMPLFATGATPRTARGRVVEAASDVPLDLGGVRVSCGDVLVGDRSGVVVIPRQRLEEVLRLAEEIAAKEAAMAADLRRGVSAVEVLGASYESMAAKIESESEK